MVEQLPYKQRVIGSNPVGPKLKKNETLFIYYISIYNKYYINNIFIIKIFMTAQLLPSILVPLTGLVFPAVAMASLFIYIEKDSIN